MKIIHKLVIVAVACSFAASTITHAGTPKSSSAPAKSAGDSRLIVSREADFGTDKDLHLFIDGVEVASLPINQSYEGVLRPGKHLLSVSTTPTDDGQMQSKRSINAKSGTTYSFTAVWKDPEIVSLQKSPGA